MAGSLAVAVLPSGHEEKPVTAIREQWEVEYSRFFGYPPAASTCPDLVPLPLYLRNRRPLGTWLTSSSPALLRLVVLRSSSGVVLTVYCGDKIQVSGDHSAAQLSSVTVFLLSISVLHFLCFVFLELKFSCFEFRLDSENWKENREFILKEFKPPLL